MPWVLLLNVGNDGEVADMTQITHGLNTQKESAGWARRK